MDEIEELTFPGYRDFSQCTEKILRQSVDIIWVYTGRVIVTKEMSIRVTKYGLVTDVNGVPKAVIDGEILWTDDDEEIVHLRPVEYAE